MCDFVVLQISTKISEETATYIFRLEELYNPRSFT
jgi:hypothetical protein